MTLLTTTPSAQSVLRAKALLERLQSKLHSLLEQSVWNEQEIETTALDLSSFQYICDPQDDYYNLESYLRRGVGPLAWTDKDIETGFALTPEAWSSDQRQAFIKQYHSSYGTETLPKNWRYYCQKSSVSAQLEGQELVDLLHSELQGCHYPPGCLKNVGPKLALEERATFEKYLFTAGYVTNQTLLTGTQEDYLKAFAKLKAADKAARERGISPSVA